MYYFNFNLLRELPDILGMTQRDFASKAGLSISTYSAWKNGTWPDVCRFVGVLNVYHISMAEFLTIEESPVVKKNKADYVIPEDQWVPIVFKQENVKFVAGEGSPSGILTYKAAAKKIGIGGTFALYRWMNGEAKMTMASLLAVINNVDIPVTLLIEDKNRNIPVIFEKDDSVWKSAQVTNVALQKRDARISELREEIASLKKENRNLQYATPERKAAMEGVAEPYVAYSPMTRGYVFHKDLWFSLPGLYNKSDRDYCAEIGLEYSGFRRRTNPSVDEVIKVCNHLHISVAHLFPPKSEPLDVYDRFYYEIPSTKFVSVESRTENLKYLFVRCGRFGYTKEELKAATGVTSYMLKEYSTEGGSCPRAITLADICTRFNVSPLIFIYDNNKNYHPNHSVSYTETLVLNCIEMSKEIERLRKRIKSMK